MGNWHITKIQDNGTRHYIVARLSLQICKILEHCETVDDQKQKIQKICIDGLMPKLIHCWEINEKYTKLFNDQMDCYCPPSQVKENDVFRKPHIIGIENMCRDFLGTYRNFVIDLLFLFNALYGTSFKEPSEFYKGDKKHVCVPRTEKGNF